MENHFCTCPVNHCPRNPSNHNQGCDPCIKDNLKKGKIPACFFLAVHGNVNGVKDYSIKGFVDFFLKQQSNKNSDKEF